MDRRTVAVATLLVILVAVAGALFGLYLEGSLPSLVRPSLRAAALGPSSPVPC